MRSTVCVGVAILGTLCACSGPSFEATVRGETTVEGSPLGGLLNAVPGVASFSSLDFNENQDFKNQGVRKEQVSSAKLRSLRIKLLSPSDQDFSFLDELEFLAKAGDEERVIAKRSQIASLDLKAPNPVLELQVQKVELQPFITAPTMSIVVRGKGRQPPEDVLLEATALFTIKVDVF